MAIDKVTSAAITDGTITSSDLASGAIPNQSAFKNIFINGEMGVAQRGTSITGINSNTYTLDRWITEGDDATITVSQDTSVPTGSDAQGFNRSLKIAVTSALSSVAADDEQKIGQRIEGRNVQQLLYGTSAAKQATLSFWVRSNVTGTYAIQFQDDDNDKVQTKTYTISSADTWEKKTVTIAANTSDSLDNDNSRSFRVLWWLTAGSNFTGDNASSGTWTARSSNLDTIAFGHNVNVMSSTSNTFYLTGCQFEVGSSASDFEFLPQTTVQQLCKRYYFAFGVTDSVLNCTGIAFSSTELNTNTNFPVEMRATPTLTFFDNSGNSARIHRNQVGDHSNAVSAVNSNNLRLPTISSTSLGSGGGYAFRLKGDAEI